MFPSGAASNPTNALVLWLSRFYKKHGEVVKSHDFRTTFATNHYRAYGDIKKTQRRMGHASVRTTEVYVKADEEQEWEE